MQTFSLEVITSGNGTIVSQALNYWQTLSSNGGGVAVGLIVEVMYLTKEAFLTPHMRSIRYCLPGLIMRSAPWSVIPAWLLHIW
jgi:hypothetical protein